MDFLHELNCPSCGRPIPPENLRGPLATCGPCRLTFRVPVSLTPAPDLGDLLLGADFRDPDLPGWKVFDRDKLEFRPGSPAEMWVRYPASDLNHAILRSPGPLDDVDASVTIRLMEGTLNHVKAGFELRSNESGDYIIHTSVQATYRVGWHNGTEWGGQLVDWTEHPALVPGLGQPNRLRVVLRGDQLRVYLNGVLATSVRDTRYTFGFVRLVVSPGNDAPMTVAFSDLQLREPL